MDDIEIGQNRAAEFVDDALREQRRRSQLAAPEEWETASAKACDECGEAIPLERRRALSGVRLCVACAAEEEMKR